MGRALDELLGRTRFRVVCPECGEVGTARWVGRPGEVACRKCGAVFGYCGNTYRPVTGGMTDEERVAYLREQKLACDRRYREAIRADPELLERYRRLKRESARRRYWARRDEILRRERERRRRGRAERDERIRSEWRKTKMGTRNTLGDLTNHLFAQLERLDDDGLTPEELEREISRSKAVTDVAEQVISTASVMLRAIQVKDGAIDGNMRIPRMLSDGGD